MTRLVRERPDITLRKNFLHDCVLGHNTLIEKAAEKLQDVARQADNSSDAVVLFRIARELSEEPDCVKVFLRTHVLSMMENDVYRYDDSYYVRKGSTAVLPLVIEENSGALASGHDQESVGLERATHSQVGSV